MQAGETAGSNPLTPFVGQWGMYGLVSAIGTPSVSRAYVYGEPGLGKTRLAEEVARQLKWRCKLLSIPKLPAGEYADLLDELRRLGPEITLLILDDIDHAHIARPEETRRVLDERPDLSIYMTSSSKEIHRSWYYALGSSPNAYVYLRELDFREARAMLAAIGVMGKPVEVALGEFGGNPGRLLAWAGKASDGILDARNSSLATILGPEGKPLRPGEDGFRRIELSVMDVSDRLIQVLAERPELMYELSSRKFEETVADLYERAGYKVDLTRPSKDGGVDFYALQQTPFGSFLTVVDCKRYRPDRPVEVGLVKSLYRTTVAAEASAGVIATTSYFTSGAKSFQTEREHRLGLQDFVSLQEMLEKAARELAELDPDEYESD